MWGEIVGRDFWERVLKGIDLVGLFFLVLILNDYCFYESKIF